MAKKKTETHISPKARQAYADAINYLGSNYDLTDESAKLIAEDYAYSCLLIQACDEHLHKHGVVIVSSNGSNYSNPSAGQRNKSSFHRLKCLKALQEYKVKVRNEELPV